MCWKTWGRPLSSSGSCSPCARTCCRLAYCEELQKLRSEVKPMPMDEVTRVVEASLGVPLVEAFPAVRSRAAGQRVHRAGARRGAAGRREGGGQGAARGHLRPDGQRHRAAAKGGETASIRAGGRDRGFRHGARPSCGTYPGRRWISCTRPTTPRNSSG